MGERGALRVCRRGLDVLLAAALAPCCAACRAPLDAPLDGPVCSVCWTSARAQLPPHLILPFDPDIDAGRAAAAYDGVVRDIIHAFKYEGRRSLAAPLGGWLRETGRDLLADAACVVPVPLHPWRRVRRGFNQASDLAAHLGAPVVHAVWRARPTLTQMTLPATDRRRNVRRAFRVAPWATESLMDRYVRDRIVVLVDDVATTGATLHACAVALRDAGAKEVRALTVAVTLKTRP